MIEKSFILKISLKWNYSTYKRTNTKRRIDVFDENNHTIDKKYYVDYLIENMGG